MTVPHSSPASRPSRTDLGIHRELKVARVRSRPALETAVFVLDRSPVSPAARVSRSAFSPD